MQCFQFCLLSDYILKFHYIRCCPAFHFKTVPFYNQECIINCFFPVFIICIFFKNIGIKYPCHLVMFIIAAEIIKNCSGIERSVLKIFKHYFRHIPVYSFGKIFGCNIICYLIVNSGIIRNKCKQHTL